jgi:hypothetical protein
VPHPFAVLAKGAVFDLESLPCGPFTRQANGVAMGALAYCLRQVAGRADLSRTGAPLGQRVPLREAFLAFAGVLKNEALTV